jgi:hypothetical protein
LSTINALLVEKTGRADFPRSGCVFQGAKRLYSVVNGYAKRRILGVKISLVFFS